MTDWSCPRRAPVRPRVRLDGGTAARPLDDEVAELLAAGEDLLVELVGPPGSGRSTALEHLAATFPDDPRLGLADTDGSGIAGGRLRVLARDRGIGARRRYLLVPWSQDEVLEYLLAAHRPLTAAVLTRWRHEPDAAALGQWPGVCRMVLDHLARHPADDVLTALHRCCGERLARWHSGAIGDRRGQMLALEHLIRADLPATDADLLRVPLVRNLLLAELMLEHVEQGGTLPLRRLDWPASLCRTLRHALDRRPESAAALAQLADSAEPARGSALSLLCAVHPGHRPAGTSLRLASDLRLVGADLHGFELTGEADRVDLSAADLRSADLRGIGDASHLRLCEARLDGAKLDGGNFRLLDGHGMQAPAASMSGCLLTAARLDRAQLDGVDLSRSTLALARLRDASLRGADLTGARLIRADLAGADLRDACCDRAELKGIDLRQTRLEGTSFRAADLTRCDLSQTVLRGLRAWQAEFRGAMLTGSWWPAADLRHCSFVDAGLADVDWQGADLRGCNFLRASFHLGSSRSGLVDSVVAGEGSRTGYYTDESLEDRFQAPEDVRKANLRDCDLRGARLHGCDFYLVDLRGARLDSAQVAWLRRCRAILDREAAAG